MALGSSEYFPATQVLHDVTLVCPSPASENVPATQAVHAAAPDTFEYFPAAQALQLEIEVAPEDEEKRPG